MHTNERHDSEYDRERGAVAVEFALILPVLLLLILGIIEFGIAFNHQQGLHAAAREGARLASLPSSTTADVDARVNDALDGLGFDGNPTISVSPGTCRNRSGEEVTVTVTADENLNIPFWDDRTVTLTGKGVFKCE